tara:strand:- start:1390 stop:1503 length:114 start_codon:yes stop_codon:yes gene_type:complete
MRRGKRAVGFVAKIIELILAIGLIIAVGFALKRIILG